MSDKIVLKPGDTFLAHCTYLDSAGDPVNLDTASIEIESSILSNDGKESFPLELTKRNQTTYPGQYYLRAATDGWPVGEHSWDIRFTVPHETGDISTSTETRKVYFGVPVS